MSEEELIGGGDSSFGEDEGEHQDYSNDKGGGWCSDMACSCGGAICGMVFLPILFYLIWFNEGRSVCIAKAFVAAFDEVVPTNCDMEAANNGKFVHFDCAVRKMGAHLDGTNFKADGFYIKAETEMYMYVEHQQQQSVSDKPQKKETCYCWSLGWTSMTQSNPASRKACRSCRETAKKARNNPAPAFSGSTATTGLGDHENYSEIELSKSKGGRKTFHVTSDQTKSINQNSQDVSSCSVTGSLVGWSKAGDYWKQCRTSTCQDVGDKRIRVSAKSTNRVSAVGMQASDGSLDAFSAGGSSFPSCGKHEILKFEAGAVTAKDISNHLHETLGTQTILLRIGAFIGIWISLVLITRPIAMFPTFLPCCGDCLGDLIGCLLCCFNFFIAISLWVTLTAIAWIFYRPLLGIGLLIVGSACGVAAYFVKHMASSRKKEELEQSSGDESGL